MVHANVTVIAIVVLDLQESTALALHAVGITENSVEDMGNVDVMETVLVTLDISLSQLLSKNVNVLRLVLEIVMVMVLVNVVFAIVILDGTYFLTVLVLSLVLMIVTEMEYATVMELAHAILAIMEQLVIIKSVATTELAKTVLPLITVYGVH